MSETLRDLKKTAAHGVKRPWTDVATPTERHSEVLADILRMAEESGPRSMDKVRSGIEKAVRATLKREPST